MSAHLCGPHHLGLEEDNSPSFIQKKCVVLTHRSGLANMNMERFPTIQ